MRAPAPRVPRNGQGARTGTSRGWTDDYHEHARNLPSAPQVRYAIESLREFFGTATIADFRKKDQDQMTATLREWGRADSYISRILSVAKAALRRAYDNEEIAAIPPIIRLARGEPRDRVLTLQEAAALFNATLNNAQFLFLLLAFGTGARPSAILELTRLQLDFERKVIRSKPARCSEASTALNRSARLRCRLDIERARRRRAARLPATAM